LQQPYFSSASRRVELCRHFVNFQENCLGDVLGFPEIAQGFERHAEDEPMITVKKDSEGIIMTGLNMCENVLVAEIAELREV